MNRTKRPIESLQAEKLIEALRIHFGCYKNSFHIPYNQNNQIPTGKYSSVPNSISGEYLIIITNYNISYPELTKEPPKEPLADPSPHIISLGEKMYQWVDNLDWPQTLIYSTVGGIVTVVFYVGAGSYRNVSIYGWDYFVASVLPVGGGLLGLGVALCAFVHFLNKLQSAPTDILKNAQIIGLDNKENKMVNHVELEKLLENVLVNGKTMIFSVKGKEEKTEPVMPAKAGIQAIKPKFN